MGGLFFLKTFRNLRAGLLFGQGPWLSKWDGGGEILLLAEKDRVLIEEGFSTGVRSSGGQRDPPHANDFMNEPSWRMVMKRGAKTRGKARPKTTNILAPPPPQRPFRSFLVLVRGWILEAGVKDSRRAHLSARRDCWKWECGAADPPLRPPGGMGATAIRVWAAAVPFANDRRGSNATAWEMGNGR